ncbi:helix-turn-helix domain-containing protein [Isoptericola sp. b441]|uniref:Helix-turn-helix domain-containing protein n=2 Tax=Cellulomonadaceae TaxID=85016 RepID=A0A7Y0LVF8_CELFI|nr:MULTISPECIES: helix-turn-helix domain-containing protein [Micrococcales]MDO8106400.1 helix-turn-helix domain-containing protein [Isoptericola sp. b441]NMR18680.1 helix-turn-helix domain-containing protein [Cellulomonas fimi]
MSDIEIIETPRVMLSVTDAAACLSIGRTTMYELIHSGAIETVHIGRLRRVPADALTQFVERCRREQHPKVP